MPIVREIIHGALQKFAVSIICAHNHPLGKVDPSIEDCEFTKELFKAGLIEELEIRGVIK